MVNPFAIITFCIHLHNIDVSCNIYVAPMGLIICFVRFFYQQFAAMRLYLFILLFNVDYFSVIKIDEKGLNVEIPIQKNRPERGVLLVIIWIR